MQNLNTEYLILATCIIFLVGVAIGVALVAGKLRDRLIAIEAALEAIGSEVQSSKKGSPIRRRHLRSLFRLLRHTWVDIEARIANAGETIKETAALVDSTLNLVDDQVHSCRTLTQKLQSDHDNSSQIWQSQLDLTHAKLEQVTRELGLANSKLDRIEGSSMSFADTPLKRWTFGEFRAARERLQDAVAEKVYSLDPTSHVKLSLHDGKLLLATELLEKSGMKEGIPHAYEHLGEAFKEWSVNSNVPVALLIPSVRDLVAATHFLPALLAILHYIEERHVKEQLKVLKKQGEYLLNVRDGAAEAALRSHWNFARELLLGPNIAFGRTGLKEICLTLAELRYTHIRESVVLYERATEPVDRQMFSIPEMNRCLRTIDRLIDAVLLELYISIALGDTYEFQQRLIPDEIQLVKDQLVRCYDIRNHRKKSIRSRLKRHKLLKVMRTAPMRLRAYNRLLNLIKDPTGNPVTLSAPLSASDPHRPRSNGQGMTHSSSPPPSM